MLFDKHFTQPNQIWIWLILAYLKNRYANGKSMPITQN